MILYFYVFLVSVVQFQIKVCKVNLDEIVSFTYRISKFCKVTVDIINRLNYKITRLLEKRLRKILPTCILEKNLPKFLPL